MMISCAEFRCSRAGSQRWSSWFVVFMRAGFLSKHANLADVHQLQLHSRYASEQHASDLRPSVII